jgi:60 kDa SS-A/Ro ribonucleoprotein
MAMTVMRTESLYEVVGYDTMIYDLGLSASMRLPDVVKELGRTGSGTDCSLPMRYAVDMQREVDVFVSLTDNETWAGDIHPADAVRRYRQEAKIDAKSVVMGMASNNFSIADPADPGQLDVVGFDASVPTILAEFAAGEV